MMRMELRRPVDDGRVTDGSSACLRGRRNSSSGARKLTDGGNFGAFDCLRQDAEGRLALPVVHLMMMQMPTYDTQRCYARAHAA